MSKFEMGPPTLLSNIMMSGLIVEERTKALSRSLCAITTYSLIAVIKKCRLNANPLTYT